MATMSRGMALPVHNTSTSGGSPTTTSVNTRTGTALFREFVVNPTTARCEAVVVPPLPPSRVLHEFPWPRAVVAGGSPAADCPAPAPAKVTAVPPPAASRKRARPAAKRTTACTARGRSQERAVRQRTREDEAALSLISIGCGGSDGGDSDDTADTTVGTTATAVPMWRLYIQAAASAGVQRPWESARCRTAATGARRRRVRATTGKRGVEGARSAGSGAKATQEATGGLRDMSSTGCDGNATDHRGPVPRGGHLGIKAGASGDCSDAFRLWLVSPSTGAKLVLSPHDGRQVTGSAAGDRTAARDGKSQAGDT